ncbi:M23 family metallopeptidase [Ornithinimicrobium sufpigmenti]|uniref:M23 family metallopeptidase n=1 Tax=Ornithinimicrobium sufpigmenti TaxID=2508882 RepID=UPI0010362018|nr:MULTISPECIES: M23 family metallopeptidase [unclassified Ornithinimicrobium]
MREWTWPRRWTPRSTPSPTGVVDYVGPGKDGRSSMIIVIAHEVEGQRVYSWYNHMYADDLYVQEGQEVAGGEVIAGVGSNGRSTGPHLHFEIHTDDELTTTDPLTWLQDQGAVDISALPCCP